MQYAGRRCRATTTARFFGHPQDGRANPRHHGYLGSLLCCPTGDGADDLTKGVPQPKLSTALTLTWVLGRISYTRRYNSGRPEKRVSNLFFQTERNLMKRFSTKAWRNGPISPHGVRGRPVMGMAG